MSRPRTMLMLTSVALIILSLTWRKLLRQPNASAWSNIFRILQTHATTHGYSLRLNVSRHSRILYCSSSVNLNVQTILEDYKSSTSGMPRIDRTSFYIIQLFLLYWKTMDDFSFGKCVWRIALYWREYYRLIVKKQENFLHSTEKISATNLPEQSPVVPFIYGLFHSVCYIVA